jgi:rhamnogalacturonan endolyase
MKTISKFKSGIYLLIALFVVICLTNNSCSSTTTTDQPKKLNHEMLSHEKLGRGLIAFPLDTGKRVFWGEGSFDASKQKVFVSWRLLASDPDNVAFNVYRTADDGKETKLTERPIGNSTNFIDGDVSAGEKLTYTVKTVVDGKEEATGQSYDLIRSKQANSYFSIKLDSIQSFERIAIGDLDGDGEYDFVVKHPGGNVDPWYLYWHPSPGTYKLDAYKSDGTHMWKYDFGWAIEQGAWYSPYIVYDFNRDGKAEIAIKSGESDPRDKEGKVTTGPEYISILDGTTGKPIAQADYIPREPFFEANKEHAYNYASRNQLAVAYLDGVNPHILVLRGTYNLQMVRAYRLIGNELKMVWDWSNMKLRDKSNNYWGQGGHCTYSVDIDNDGKDEVVLGSSALDHNGKELWTTGLGHSDGAYIADLIPEHPGLEIYYMIEPSKTEGNGMCMVDAKTGKIIWGSNFPTDHVHGNGLCSDIDRAHPGRECYGTEITGFEGKRTNFSVLYSNKGEIIGESNLKTTNSAFWDSDNQREMVGRGSIYEFNGPTVFGTQPEGRVIAIADILGDWREEIVTSVSGELRIYSTPILADTRHTCLMQDPIYRNNVAHASDGYYQIPSTTYDIPFGSSKY